MSDLKVVLCAGGFSVERAGEGMWQSVCCVKSGELGVGTIF